MFVVPPTPTTTAGVMDQLEGEKDAAGAKVAKLEGQIKQAEKCVLSHVGLCGSTTWER